MLSFGPPHPPGSTPIEDWAKDLPDGTLARVSADRLTFPANVPDWIKGPNRGKRGKGDEDPGARHHMHGYYASILALEDQVERLLRRSAGVGRAGEGLDLLDQKRQRLAGALYSGTFRLQLGRCWGASPRGRGAVGFNVTPIVTALLPVTHCSPQLLPEF